MMRIETKRAVFATALIAGFLFGLGACRDSKTRTVVAGRTGQLDRMGKPGINTLLVRSARKDEFNRAQPRDDVAAFQADAVGILMATPYNRTAADAGVVMGLLFPDVLTINPTSTADYVTGPLNGRQADDDVIDISLQVLTGSGGATDGVNADDQNGGVFPVTFPYLHPPVQPN